MAETVEESHMKIESVSQGVLFLPSNMAAVETLCSHATWTGRWRLLVGFSDLVDLWVVKVEKAHDPLRT